MNELPPFPTNEQLKALFEASKADPRTKMMGDEGWFVMGAAMVENHMRAAVEAAQPEAVPANWRDAVWLAHEHMKLYLTHYTQRHNVFDTLESLLAAAPTPTESQPAEADERSEREALARVMADKLMCWRLPADFHPDGGISFKPYSDYDHPELGRTKHEPFGTNLFTHEQAVAMLLDIMPAALSAPTAPAQAEPKLTHIHRADPEAAAKAHRDATPPATAAGPSDAERLDWAADAREWGNALNSASWEFDEAYHRHMGEPCSGKLFNRAKLIVRDAILKYAERVAAIRATKGGKL